MLTFQVWREGQDPNVNESYIRLTATVENGTAKVTWQYRHESGRELPEDDPKYFFTVHSAWCPPERSDDLIVEMRRPQMSEHKWLDLEETKTDKTLVGETVTLQVSCKDMEENAPVIFRVYKHGDNPKHDKPAEELQGSNKEGVARQEWTYRYRHDPENPLTEKPKFFFTASSPRCKEEKSETVEIEQDYELTIKDEDGIIFSNTECTVVFSDGTENNSVTNDEGKVIFRHKIPGIVISVKAENPEGKIISLI
jgi:hypothetical protein